MSVTSAMYTGISGLTANGEAISVISNNLANSNTIGYKTGRMLFSDALSSSLGNNSQLGHGVKIQAVQNIFSSGSTQNTESGTDLAIQGDSFFVVQQPGGSNYYTRAGAFTFNNSNILTNPDGYQVMGYGINSESGLNNGVLGAIDMTKYASLAPKMTTEVSMVANLDKTQVVPGSAVTAAITTSGNPYNTTSPTATVYDINGVGHTATFTFTPSATAGVMNWSATIADATPAAVNGTATFTAAGAFSSQTGASQSVTINGVTQALNFDLSGMSENVGVATTASNPVGTQTGGAAGATATTALDFTGLLNSVNPPSGSITTTIYDNVAGTFAAHDATTTFTQVDATHWTWSTVFAGADIVAGVDTGIVSGTLSFAADGTTPVFAVTSTNTNPVYSGTASTITFGATAMTGIDLTAGTAPSALADGSAAVAWDPTNPTATSNYSNGMTVYDSQGGAHTVTTYFRKTDTNEWEWHASIDGGTPAWVDGTLTFNKAGILTSQTPAASVAQNITFPGVTTPQAIKFDYGANTTTQYASASTVTSKSQDGYAQGSLTSKTIDSEGYVIGVYSNGESKKVAQIALARFASTDGLQKAGSSLFQETLASGQALLSDASTPGTGSLLTNTLEGSNVDMATEFVKLIQSQRAYSANSKTITTADQMTQEVLGLIR